MTYQGRFNVCLGGHNLFTDETATVSWLLLSVMSPDQVSMAEIYEWCDRLGEYQQRDTHPFLVQ